MSRARNASKKRRSQANEPRKHCNNRRQFKDALEWLLNEKIFDGITIHGNTSWLPVDLSVLALLWMWSSASNLTDAFDDATVEAKQLMGRVALTTYQGLAGALQTWTPIFMPRLQITLHEQMQKIGEVMQKAGAAAGAAQGAGPGAAAHEAGPAGAEEEIQDADVEIIEDGEKKD